MSGQISPHNTVRLLVAEGSENTTQEIDSLLRGAGISTRLNHISNLDNAEEAITNSDLMLLNSDMAGAKEVLPRLRASAPNVPIILRTSSEETAIDIEQGLTLGATDVVYEDRQQHLVLVFKRELEHVCQAFRSQQAEKALAESEKRCELLLASSSTAIAYVHEGMHIYANENYQELFGFEDADELFGLPLIDLLDQESAKQLKAALKSFRTNEEQQTFEFTGSNSELSGAMTLTGAEYDDEPCIQVIAKIAKPVPHLTLVADADSEPETLTDIEDAGSSLELPKEELANNQAAPTSTNPQTLPDFIETCDSAVEEDEARCKAMFVVQLDNFANLQKENGISGAELISGKVEDTLRNSAESGLCFRISASQFALLIMQNSANAARTEVEACRAAVEELILEVNAKTVRSTISLCGIEVAQGHSAQTALDGAFQQMLKNADAQLHNVIEFSSIAELAADSEVVDESAQVLKTINSAIENQSFVLLFQPIISLRGDDDEHYEVFLRMLDARGEHMVPHQFLETATASGVAGKIDRWVILQAIKTLSLHRSKGHDTRLTINITYNSIVDPEFTQWLGVAIKAARLPSDAVVFQVTEKDARTYMRQSVELVAALKAMHCRSGLSRFTPGPESSELLKHISVDMVKLEGNLTATLEAGEEGVSALTESIKALQSKGMLTVVPMVENANVLSRLWQAGANYIQGHYLQEPSTTMDYDFTTED